MLTDLSTLPDHSRLWIFAADRKLSQEESRELLMTVTNFLESWKAHGAPVASATELQHQQFLVIAANPDVTAPSGCSIDALTRSLQEIGAQHNVNLMNSGQVYFEDNGEISWTTRPQFKQLARDGRVSLATPVYDNSLTTLGAYRGGNWRLPAERSWHRGLIE